MDNFQGVRGKIFKSFANSKNQGYSIVSSLGGIFCGIHISLLPVSAFLNWAKPVLAICAVILAPPTGVFMKDVYENKIRHRIFKNKK